MTNCRTGYSQNVNLSRSSHDEFSLSPHQSAKGHAAAGELSKIFAVDVTAAEVQCAHCGATRRFAEAHLYLQCPGVVARCAVCKHVLLRLANVRQRVFLEVRGMDIPVSTEHSYRSSAENLGIEKEPIATGVSSSEGRAHCASYYALLQIATGYVEARR